MAVIQSGLDEARAFRLALESARVLVWEMDSVSGCITYRDAPEALMAMGFRADILPRSLPDWLGLLHPEERARTQSKLDIAFQQSGFYEDEYRVVLPGTVRWISTRGRVYGNPEGGRIRMLGVSLDITDRKHSEAELRERDQTLDAVFSASPDAINLLDLNGVVRFASPAVRDVFGRDPQEQIGVSVATNVHPDDIPMVRDALRDALSGSEIIARRRVRYRHGGGHWLVIEVDGQRITDDAGNPTGLVLVSRDVTDQAFVEESLRNAKEALADKVRERTIDLEAAQIEILERLARAAEFRDDATGQHIRRVGDNAARLACLLGLPEEDVNLIRRAAPLHDVGKIGIPDQIFLKPGRCTPEEFLVIKTHTTIGGQILGGGQFPLLRMAEEIALSHHERWDGMGYPGGLSGHSIPLLGRIVAVVDVYDALTSERPYKSAWTPEAARDELSRERAKQFDPEIVEAFLSTEEWEDARNLQ